MASTKNGEKSSVSHILYLETGPGVGSAAPSGSDDVISVCVCVCWCYLQ